MKNLYLKIFVILFVAINVTNIFSAASSSEIQHAKIQILNAIHKKDKVAFGRLTQIYGQSSYSEILQLINSGQQAIESQERSVSPIDMDLKDANESSENTQKMFTDMLWSELYKRHPNPAIISSLIALGANVNDVRQHDFHWKINKKEIVDSFDGILENDYIDYFCPNQTDEGDSSDSEDEIYENPNNPYADLTEYQVFKMNFTPLLYLTTKRKSIIIYNDINDLSEIIAMFIDNGANVNYKNLYGFTSLFTLLLNDNLISLKSRNNSQAASETFHYLYPKGPFGRNLLLTSFRLLIENGADVNCQIPGTTQGYYEFLKSKSVLSMLTSMYESFIKNPVTKISKSYKVINLDEYLKYYSYISQEVDKTIFMPTVIQELINQYTNPAIEKEEIRADATFYLFQAIQIDSLKMAKFAISLGADVNGLNSTKYTPLMMARTPEMMQLLIDNFADLNYVNEAGKSVLTNISRCKLEYIVKIGFDFTTAHAQKFIKELKDWAATKNPDINYQPTNIEDAIKFGQYLALQPIFLKL